MNNAQVGGNLSVTQGNGDGDDAMANFTGGSSLSVGRNLSIQQGDAAGDAAEVSTFYLTFFTLFPDAVVSGYLSIQQGNGDGDTASVFAGMASPNRKQAAAATCPSTRATGASVMRRK